MSFAGIGPTELRILLAIGACFVARNPWATIAGHRALLLDVGGAIAAAGLVGVFIISSVRNARALYLQEPLPKPPAHAAARDASACGARRAARGNGMRSTAATRVAPFVAVGVLGFLVQIAALRC